MIVVNKIWKDTANSVGGAVAIANSGGECFQYGCRLQIHVGGVAKAGVKKLKAVYKGEGVKIKKLKIDIPGNRVVTISGDIFIVLPDSKRCRY